MRTGDSPAADLRAALIDNESCFDMMHDDWQTTAWNGIALATPRSWSVAGIDRRYLLFESDGRHVLEIKWSEKKTAGSPQKQLSRLMRRQPRQIRRSFKTRSVDLPPAIADGYEHIGFSWEARGRSGRGTILFCRICGKMTLMQILGRDDSFADDLEKEILGSFKDHFPGDSVPWQIYDIRAAVPQSFGLDAFRFDAGRFELIFSNRQNAIHLQRWGPADVLTAEDGLEGFVRKIGLISETAPRRSERDDPTAIEWSEAAAVSGKNLLGWLKRVCRPEFRRTRVWLKPSGNRILAVRVTCSGKPVDKPFFTKVCAGYESCQ